MTDVVESPALVRLNRLDDAGLAAMFTEARTANTFAPTPVTDAELIGIWNLAKWPPTAANFQPVRVLYVRQGPGRDRLVTHMNPGNQAKTAAAPAVAVLALDTQFHEHIPTLLPFRPELREAFAADEDKRLDTARYNAALQTGYFIMAVRASGLAAGPMGGFNAETLDADFFPDGRWRSTLVVNIGHPGHEPWLDRLPRLPDSDVLRWA